MTRGHNIVADGWAGASNPQPHPNHTPNPPPTHSHTNNTNCSIINTCFSRFHFERDNLSVTDGLMDQRTDGQADKASYRAACPQLKILNVKNLRQGFEPWGWDLSFGTGIWGLRLEFEPGGRDLSLEAGIWVWKGMDRRRRRRRRRRNFALSVKT